MFSTMGRYYDKCGGYLEYHGGVQYHGSTQIARDNIPHGTEHPHSTKDIPHMYHDNLNGTEHPPQYSTYPPWY